MDDIYITNILIHIILKEIGIVCGLNYFNLSLSYKFLIFEERFSVKDDYNNKR